MTAQLLKQLLAVALIAIAALSFAGQASADYALTNTVLNANSNGVGPGLPGVTTIDDSPLRFYTNNYNGIVGVGADERTVFAATISAAHDNVSYGPPILGPGGGTTYITILGAVDSTVTSVVNGASTVTITSGGFGLYTSTAPINTADPVTWMSPNTSTNPFATFTLDPAANVAPGSSSPAQAAQIGPFAASQVNQSTVNLNSLTQSIGRVVFGNGPGASGFLLPGDTSAPQPPSGLFITFGQSVETSVTAANSGLNGTDLAFMNSLESTYAGVSQWASDIGTSSNPSQWNPNGGANGDFRAQGIGVEMYPFAPAVIPEPASVTLMGIGLGGLFLAIRRRKNKAQA